MWEPQPPATLRASMACMAITFSLIKVSNYNITTKQAVMQEYSKSAPWRYTARTLAELPYTLHDCFPNFPQTVKKNVS
jgi:hypothetical protein